MVVSPVYLNEYFSLTVKEVDIIKLLAEGYSYKMIGYEMGISEATVKNHMTLVFKKLKVGNNVGAVVKSLKIGILELEKINI